MLLHPSSSAARFLLHGRKPSVVFSFFSPEASPPDFCSTPPFYSLQLLPFLYSAVLGLSLLSLISLSPQPLNFLSSVALYPNPSRQLNYLGCVSFSSFLFSFPQPRSLLIFLSPLLHFLFRGPFSSFFPKTNPILQVSRSLPFSR